MQSQADSDLYAQAMSRHALLDREGERALAVEIEDKARALWAVILTRPETVALAQRVAAERLPDAVKLLAKPSKRTPERIRALDLDHDLADEIVARAGKAKNAKAIARAQRAVSTARGRFVQSNIGLVMHVAARYRSPFFTFDDFVQEGMFGLIKAVDRFDHRRGLRFSTFATWWIRHAMGRALADKSRLVRLPVHVQETRQKLHAVARGLRDDLERDPSREEIAHAAGMTPDKVEQVLEANNAHELSLDEVIGDDDGRSRGDVFRDPTDPEPHAGDSLHRRKLATVAKKRLDALSPTERDVLRRRFGLDGRDEEATLREIAESYGLSRERIRQIQEAALQKLRAQMARHDS